MGRVAYDAFDPIDLSTNMFVRADCLNTVLAAIDAPLGEASGAPVSDDKKIADPPAAAAPAAAPRRAGGRFNHPQGPIVRVGPLRRPRLTRRS